MDGDLSDFQMNARWLPSRYDTKSSPSGRSVDGVCISPVRRRGEQSYLANPGGSRRVHRCRFRLARDWMGRWLCSRMPENPGRGRPRGSYPGLRGDVCDRSDRGASIAYTRDAVGLDPGTRFVRLLLCRGSDDRGKLAQRAIGCQVAWARFRHLHNG